MKEKESNFISIVIYVNNNEDKIIEFLQKINIEMSHKFKNFEYILVDDYSEDNTKEKIRIYSEEIEANVTLIELPWKYGKENAMIAGVDMSIGDFVYEFDTIELNYELDLITLVYDKMLEGYDIVAAIPNSKKNRSSKLFYKILNYSSNNKIEITTETFRIISRRAINRIFKSNERFKYRKILYHYSGFDTYYYYYNLLEGQSVKSSMKLSERINLATDILIIFSDFGAKFSLTFSILFFFMGIITTIYTLSSYLIANWIQPGWTTIMLFLSLSFSGLFFILTIVIKYLNVILKEIQSRDSYIYKKVSKLN